MFKEFPLSIAFAASKFAKLHFHFPQNVYLISLEASLTHVLFVSVPFNLQA